MYIAMYVCMYVCVFVCVCVWVCVAQLSVLLRERSFDCLICLFVWEISNQYESAILVTKYNYKWYDIV